MQTGSNANQRFQPNAVVMPSGRLGELVGNNSPGQSRLGFQKISSDVVTGPQEKTQNCFFRVLQVLAGLAHQSAGTGGCGRKDQAPPKATLLAMVGIAAASAQAKRLFTALT